MYEPAAFWTFAFVTITVLWALRANESVSRLFASLSHGHGYANTRQGYSGF